MTTRPCIAESLADVDETAWNQLAGNENPFTFYAFLRALETEGCLDQYGWHPQHILHYNADNTLVGAAPAYAKTNSYGELVFDWAWADAARRGGLRYYPKLVIGVPYTPATGPRLLGRSNAIKQQLVATARQLVKDNEWSSLHILFPHKEDLEIADQAQLKPRLAQQYHWHNQGYQDFDDFLSTFTAKNRKKTKRERRRVQEADIQIERKLGSEVSEAEWHIWHQLYTDTFDKRGGLPTLSKSFFLQLAQTMPEKMLLVLCKHQGEIKAAALNFIGNDTLYGRHWGAFEDFHSLHFETCYYQGIEFAIEQKLSHFEPGAQGEYKIRRGFLPTEVWSAHWLQHEGLARAVEQFINDETEAVHAYMDELAMLSPYREAGG